MDDERMMLYWDSMVGDIDACILTDWPNHYNHALAMTAPIWDRCPRSPEDTLTVQLAEILARLRIVLE